MNHVSPRLGMSGQIHRILHHQSNEAIYLAHKSGVQIEDLAALYKTTPALIRRVLTRYHRKLLKAQFGPVGKEPA